MTNSHTQNQSRSAVSGSDLLLEVPLSSEARNIVAQSYQTGQSLSVARLLPLYDDCGKRLRLEASDTILRLVAAGFGPEAAQSVAQVNKMSQSPDEALRLVQESVQSGESLIAIAWTEIKSGPAVALSINHAIADEATLDQVEKLASSLREENSSRKTLRDLREGRNKYLAYVANQQVRARELARSRDDYTIGKALKLATNGPFGVCTKMARVSISQRFAGIGGAQIAAYKAFPAFLEKIGAVHEGNVICSSRNWRSTETANALGMATGLVPLTECLSGAKSKNAVLAHEAAPRTDSNARRLLLCCVNSDVFINGAEPRGISSTQVLNPNFPMGVEIGATQDGELIIEVDGPFLRPTDVADALKSFSQSISSGTDPHG